jgi:hypothetical protein
MRAHDERHRARAEARKQRGDVFDGMSGARTAESACFKNSMIKTMYVLVLRTLGKVWLVNLRYELADSAVRAPMLQGAAGSRFSSKVLVAPNTGVNSTRHGS